MSLQTAPMSWSPRADAGGGGCVNTLTLGPADDAAAAASASGSLWSRGRPLPDCALRLCRVPILPSLAVLATARRSHAHLRQNSSMRRPSRARQCGSRRRSSDNSAGGSTGRPWAHPRPRLAALPSALPWRTTPAGKTLMVLSHSRFLTLRPSTSASVAQATLSRAIAADLRVFAVGANCGTASLSSAPPIDPVRSHGLLPDRQHLLAVPHNLLTDVVPLLRA